MYWISVGVGGAIGAMSRYALSGLVRNGFPLGTFLANIIGCLLIGILMALSVKTGWPGPRTQSFLITGFLGGLTTFSTYAWQTWELNHSGNLSLSIWNLISNLIVGLLAVWLGVMIGELLAQMMHST